MHETRSKPCRKKIEFVFHYSFVGAVHSYVVSLCQYFWNNGPVLSSCWLLKRSKMSKPKIIHVLLHIVWTKKTLHHVFSSYHFIPLMCMYYVASLLSLSLLLSKKKKKKCSLFAHSTPHSFAQKNSIVT